jgi:hypothetical protein
VISSGDGAISETSAMNEKQAKSSFPIWLVVILAIPLLLAMLGVFAALAVYGVRRYITNAKAAEGMHVSAAIASGVARCAAEPDERGQPRGLPETTHSVPPSLPAVSGKKYQSAASEWSQPAFVCAGFVLTDPQYFQYQWVRSSATSGTVIALADLDGDGMPEVSVESRVECSAAGRCVAAPPTR